MRPIFLAVLVAAAAFAQPATAGKTKQVRYVGIHPVPKSEGGGICYIEGPHVHIFGANKLEYRDHRGANYFVGDPVAYGYDGPHYPYKGHHPIHVDAVVGDGMPDEEYCYIDGPHFHPFQVQGPEFKMVGDAYFYVGEPPRARRSRDRDQPLGVLRSRREPDVRRVRCRRAHRAEEAREEVALQHAHQQVRARLAELDASAARDEDRRLVAVLAPVAAGVPRELELDVGAVEVGARLDLVGVIGGLVLDAAAAAVGDVEDVVAGVAADLDLHLDADRAGDGIGEGGRGEQTERSKKCRGAHVSPRP